MKTNGNPRFVKHKQLRSFYCDEIGSSAFRLARSTYYQSKYCPALYLIEEEVNCMSV